MGSPTIQPAGTQPTPSTPVAVDSPNHPPQPVTVNGETYRPLWDFRTGGWDMVDKLGRSLYSTTVSPPLVCRADPGPGLTPMQQLMEAGKPVITQQLRQQAAREAMQSAFDKMMKERGPEIMNLKARMQEMREATPNYQNQRTFEALKQDLLKILDEYAPKQVIDPGATCQREPDASGDPPSPPGNSPATPSGMFVSLPTGAAKSAYAPDIAPQYPERWGDVGGLEHVHDALRASVEHAYAYDGEPTGGQVANDLDRLARAKYKEIHVLSGAHGAPNSAIGSPDHDQLELDRDIGKQLEQRFANQVKVVVHDATNPQELMQFIGLQRDAAAGRSPEIATLDAICYGRNRMSDPHGATPVAPPTGELPLDAAAARGGAAAFSGVLMIDSGLSDPNARVGAAKMASGGAQILGGGTYLAGVALESPALTRFGSLAGEIGGHAAAPLIAYDVYRHMQQHIQGDPRPQAEKNLEGLNDGLALGALVFPEFALPALGISLVFMPMADYSAQKAAPVFVGGMSQAYGVSEDILSRWSE